MAAPSPVPRRINTPSWLDLRLVLGVVLVLAAVLLGATLLSRAGDTQPAVTATRDLAAGTVLRADELRIAQVQLPGGRRGLYVSDLGDAVGKKLGRAVSRGELVPAGAIGRVTAHTTLTVPFASGNAPDLRPGQRIEVFVSTASCASVVLLRDVTVQQVDDDAGGSFSDGAGGQNVVIDVEPELAGRVVAALGIDQAQVRAGVLVGAPVPATALAPAPQSGGLPTDLAACAGTGSR